jgi:hypothetical protein
LPATSSLQENAKAVFDAVFWPPGITFWPVYGAVHIAGAAVGECVAGDRRRRPSEVVVVVVVHNPSSCLLVETDSRKSAVKPSVFAESMSGMALIRSRRCTSMSAGVGSSLVIQGPTTTAAMFRFPASDKKIETFSNGTPKPLAISDLMFQRTPKCRGPLAMIFA